MTHITEVQSTKNLGPGRIAVRTLDINIRGTPARFPGRVIAVSHVKTDDIHYVCRHPCRTYKRDAPPAVAAANLVVAAGFSKHLWIPGNLSCLPCTARILL